jgi:hypothetical protein
MTHARPQINPGAGAFRRILSDQIARYPLMQVRDLYKLIHQAALGSEHAVRDPNSARAWFDREVKELGPGPADPMIDPISADGRIVRVHLRPFIQAGGDLEMLLDAFVRTANEYRGEITHLHEYVTAARQMAHAGLLPFAPTDLDEFFATMKKEQYPAAHHSSVYEATYHPAYRVVARDYLSL